MSWYNQILLKESNEDKSTFIIEWGTFCYTIIPFGMWNARSTFQRLVDKVFENQIGQSVLTYMDDILVKFVVAVDHAKNLEETLGTSAKYGMQLNPAKCMFEVEEENF